MRFSAAGGALAFYILLDTLVVFLSTVTDSNYQFMAV